MTNNTKGLVQFLKRFEVAMKDIRPTKVGIWLSRPNGQQ